jgi:hypothetical protein
MKAFVTGSRAYGTPRYDSDLDIVIRMDYDYALTNFIHNPEYVLSSYGDCQDTFQIKTDTVNLIICCTDEAYEKWYTGTESLKAIRPVTREVAIELFKSLGV